MLGLYCIALGAKSVFEVFPSSAVHCIHTGNFCPTVAQLTMFQHNVKQKENFTFQDLSIPKDLPKSSKIFPSGGLGARGEAKMSPELNIASNNSINIWCFCHGRPPKFLIALSKHT